MTHCLEIQDEGEGMYASILNCPMSAFDKILAHN